MHDLIEEIVTSRNDIHAREFFSAFYTGDAEAGNSFSSDANMSGIFVFFALAFILNRVPLFTPNFVDLENLRGLIVHWTKSRTLPF